MSLEGLTPSEKKQQSVENLFASLDEMDAQHLSNKLDLIAGVYPQVVEDSKAFYDALDQDGIVGLIENETDNLVDSSGIISLFRPFLLDQKTPEFRVHSIMTKSLYARFYLRIAMDYDQFGAVDEKTPDKIVFKEAFDTYSDLKYAQANPRFES